MKKCSCDKAHITLLFNAARFIAEPAESNGILRWRKLLEFLQNRGSAKKTNHYQSLQSD